LKVEENIKTQGKNVPGEWRKLHNEDFHDLYCSPTIVRVIKSKIMSWVGHVARMGRGEACTGVLMGKSEGKRHMGIPRCRWEDRWIFRKCDAGLRTELGWLRIETGGGHL
jgi:hypothetical protein